MARTEDPAAFYLAVYLAVQKIPPGRVTSYGHIAKLIGTPHRPRQVGICLKHLPRDPHARHHAGNVPWQRVINAKGVISPRSQPSGAREQAAALRAEGVKVSADAMGELSVNLANYGWFPNLLPSEKAGGDRHGNQEEVKMMSLKPRTIF
ncbi:MGMT family protein [Xylaria sp. CBS 124048]|nr:MGMT family protein [Xylaria sp. CBS 124048]